MRLSAASTSASRASSDVMITSVGARQSYMLDTVACRKPLCTVTTLQNITESYAYEIIDAKKVFFYVFYYVFYVFKVFFIFFGDVFTARAMLARSWES